MKPNEIEALCRAAYAAEDGYGDAMQYPARYGVFRDGFYAAFSTMHTWQSIETLPEHLEIDVFVRSRNNPAYARRAENICRVDGKWFGREPPDDTCGEYAAYWMPLPNYPKVDTMTRESK